MSYSDVAIVLSYGPREALDLADKALARLALQDAGKRLLAPRMAVAK